MDDLLSQCEATHTAHRLYRFSPPLKPDFAQLDVGDGICDVGNLDIEGSHSKIVVSCFLGRVEGCASRSADLSQHVKHRTRGGSSRTDSSNSHSAALRSGCAGSSFQEKPWKPMSMKKWKHDAVGELSLGHRRQTRQLQQILEDSAKMLALWLVCLLERPCFARSKMGILRKILQKGEHAKTAYQADHEAISCGSIFSTLHYPLQRCWRSSAISTASPQNARQDQERVCYPQALQTYAWCYKIGAGSSGELSAEAAPGAFSVEHSGGCAAIAKLDRNGEVSTTCQVLYG